jgi:heterodisulfide reductase subunit A
VHKEDHEAATLKAMDMVAMAVEKAVRLEPLEISKQPMVQAALVVGGGVAGMTAASNLARQGYETHLVEREPELGGLVAKLDEISPSGIPAHEFVAGLRNEVEASGVNLHVGTGIEHIGGHIGDFSAHLTDGADVRAGAVILAMGARAHEPTEQQVGRDLLTITNLDLESMWNNVPGERVTMVGCVGSRGDGAGCSRYCCESMVGQALRLRRMGKKVRVLYRDIRTFSREAEELYEQSAREGVQFIRYPDVPSEKAVRFDDESVTVHDELLDADIRIPTDLVVLATALRPPEEDVSQQLKVSHSEDGFLLEKHPKLGPVEAGSPGIFLAGAVQGPKDVRESIAQGLATAGKAAALLSRDMIEKEPITAQVDLEKCIFCGRCVPVVRSGHQMLGPVKQGPIQFIEAACQGCGPAPRNAIRCHHDALLHEGTDPGTDRRGAGGTGGAKGAGLCLQLVLLRRCGPGGHREDPVPILSAHRPQHVLRARGGGLHSACL